MEYHRCTIVRACVACVAQLKQCCATKTSLLILVGSSKMLLGLLLLVFLSVEHYVVGSQLSAATCGCCQALREVEHSVLLIDNLCAWSGP